MSSVRSFLASLVVVPYWVLGGLLMDARRALLRRLGGYRGRACRNNC